MKNSEDKKRTGHPITGIVMGLAGIAISLLLTLLFGVIAGAAALLLGIGAVITGIRARRGGRGAAAIAAGALAMVLAVTTTLGSVALMDRMQSVARKSGVAPVFSECFETPCLGISGILFSTAGDKTRMKAVMNELDTLRIMAQESADSGAAADRAEA